MTPEPVTEEFCPVIRTTVEEVVREAAEYAQDRRLSPEEIEALAQRFIDCTDPAGKKSCVARSSAVGTGESTMPKLLRLLPRGVFAHLLERADERQITVAHRASVEGGRRRYTGGV